MRIYSTPTKLVVNCDSCGKTFSRKRSELHGKRTFCSHSCRATFNNKLRKKQPLSYILEQLRKPKRVGFGKAQFSRTATVKPTTVKNRLKHIGLDMYSQGAAYPMVCTCFTDAITVPALIPHTFFLVRIKKTWMTCYLRGDLRGANDQQTQL